MMRKLLIFSACLLVFSPVFAQSENLNDEQKDAFTSLAIIKCRELGYKISTLCSRSVGAEIKEQTIESAVELFSKEENEIEVSNLRRKKPRIYEVRSYLHHLKSLIDKNLYDSISVKWDDVTYVGKFKKAVDGSYEATVSISQSFVGYKQNGERRQVKYSDITKKDIQIIIREVTKVFDGEEVVFYDVFLGNIRATETRQANSDY